MSAQRYCGYCRSFKPDEGFKFVLHVNTGSKRGQCPPCQELRKKPRSDLEAMARREQELRSKTLSEAAKRSAAERKKNGK